MTGWTHANAARIRLADIRAQQLAKHMPGCRTFKEACWKAGIPVRTAQRLRERIG